MLIVIGLKDMRNENGVGKIKILNLYSGIGGNRKLWTPEGNEHEITAIEINPEIAEIYQYFFPNDKVIIADAHQFLLEHFEEYDFIWSSPPCPTHSRLNFLNNNKGEQGQEPKYPDMRLYEEIIFLKYWFKGKWVVENVVSYYPYLIEPFRYNSHYFWSNFYIGNSKDTKRYIREHLSELEMSDEYKNIKIKNKEQIINNAVKPETGLYIFNAAFKIKQNTVGDFLSPKGESLIAINQN